MPRIRIRLLMLAFLTVLIALPSVAQTVDGVIAGSVTDPSGAVIGGAAVTLTNAGTGATQTTTSGSNGAYRFALVPPGTYTLQFKAAGFGTEKVNGVLVQASQTVPYSAKLRVASEQQVVEVTSEAPLVQTETSDLSLQVDNTTIQNMALVDRDVFGTLPMLAPQAMPGLDNTITAGGARESGTSFMLNGSEDNDNFGEGSANVTPPLESVQDFSVLTNNMSAEYGRGMGALITANQKSGTNRFHGVVYEFNRNASLNANDWFYNQQYDAQQGLSADERTLTPKLKYIKNQFGGEADGPIFRDKTFFAAAYDRSKLVTGTTSAHNYVPTSAALAYLKTNGGPLAQAVIAAFPPLTSDQSCNIDGTPTGTEASTEPNGLPNFVGCLSFFDPVTDTVDTYFGKVDHTFSAKDRLSFTANISRELNVDKYGGGPLTSNGPINGNTTNHFHNLSLNEVHTFGSSIINQFTVAHNRHYNVYSADAAETVPNIYIDNQNEGGLGYSIGGVGDGSQIQNFSQDRWSFLDNVTWTKGRHSFKFGIGNQYGILYRNWDLGKPGYYEFGELITTQCADGATSGCPVLTASTDGTMQSDGTIANVQSETNANFAGDYPYYQEMSIDPTTGQTANAYRHYTNHDWYWFVQDDFKVTPRLTLNVGLRWDRYGSPSEVSGKISQFTNFNSCSYLDASCLATLRVGHVDRMWTTANNDYGPRFGFAFDPKGDGKMAVRGGYGISYDRIFDNIWSNGAWNPPYFALIDFEADTGDAIYYSNPASIGAAYNPNGACGQIPYASSTGCSGKRVSLRTMDANMHDSSGQNFYLGFESEIPAGILARVQYQGEMGRHLPMLENLNRVSGDAANSSLSPVYPNALYNGFNYRSNSVSSNYNALIVQAQKRMKNGVQFDTSYTFSKLMDENSELFAGCSTIGGQSAPYYYTTNANPKLEYGRGSFDHRNSFKLSVVYQEPFFKNQSGFTGHVLGGWTLGGLFQFYSGHPVDVWDGRTRYAARDVTTNAKVLDASGVPYNLGGDYNLDGVANDRPVFVGGNKKNVYSHATPAKGIFTDNNIIGCSADWVPGNVNVAACNTRFGATTPNSLFVTPNYPGSTPTYNRYGTLGRNVFTGPDFAQMDVSLSKTFRFAERCNLDLKAQAQNVANHPNFDAVTGNLGSANFGKAQDLVPFGLGAPKARVMSLGARLAF